MMSFRKKLIFPFFSFALLIVATLFFAPTEKVQAEELFPLTGSYTDSSGNTFDGSGNILDNGAGGVATPGADYDRPFYGPGGDPSASVNQNADSAGAKKSAITSPKQPEINGCGLFNLDGCVAWAVNLLMWIVSFFLYLSGYIFDISMQFTLNISDLMTRVPVVDIGWKIFRDLSNIFFIFILLWISISTILGLNSGETKELVTHLVIVALLINFSLFITKTVIDGSNIIAMHFYNLIVVPSEGSTASFSGAFMQGLKIQTIYDGSAIGEAGGEKRGVVMSALKRAWDVGSATVVGAATAGPVAGVVAGGAALFGGNAINWGKIILIGIFGSALMLIAAYVFLVGAVLMLLRAVALMFVMMLSPLAFLAYALPGGEEYAKSWKEALIKQVIFAPAFMALSFVVVKTIQSDAFKGVVSVSVGNPSLASAFTTGSGGGVAMIVNFLLIIGLMLGCILVAKKLEVHGLEFSQHVGAAGARWAASGRYISTAGSVISYASKAGGNVFKSIGLKNYGEGLANFGKKVDEKSGKWQENADVVGWDKKLKNSAFGKNEFGNFIREQTTGRLVEAKFGGEKSLHESHKESEELKNRARDISYMQEARGLAKTMKASEETIRKLEESNGDTTEEKSKLSDTQDDLEKVLGKMSTKGFVEVGKELYLNDKIMKHASAEKINALMKDEHTLTDHEKEEAMEKRWGEDDREFKRSSDAGKIYRAAQISFKEKEVSDPSYSTTIPGIDDSKNLEILRVKAALDPSLKKKMKNMKNIGEFEMINRHYSKMFENESFLERIPQGMVERIRESEVFTSRDKERVRNGKNAGLEDAGWANLGIDIYKEGGVGDMSDEEQSATKSKLEKELSDDKNRFDASHINTPEAKALREYAKYKILEVLGGKGGGELAKAPSGLWGSDIVMRNMGAGAMYEFKPEDEDDKRKLFVQMLREVKEDPSKISNVLEEKLLWVLNKREGQTFLNVTNAINAQKDSVSLTGVWESMIKKYATGEKNPFTENLAKKNPPQPSSSNSTGSVS